MKEKGNLNENGAADFGKSSCIHPSFLGCGPHGALTDGMRSGYGGSHAALRSMRG
ncbi:MAG: hypothetical protein MZV63_30645 [Marinilabiliales bacterium]|nr:hypothetical protein [Marinilabiliales bacterium]